MISRNETVAQALRKAELIWKDLVKNHPSDFHKVSDVLSRYKALLEESNDFSRESFKHFQEIEVIESILVHYRETGSIREKKILLNNAYVGLIFSISELVEELKVQEEAVEEELSF